MKVLIVEEALKTLNGHWFQYISDIVLGGREAGHQVEVAVHKGACQEITKAFPCHPILQRSVFEQQAVSAGKMTAFKRVFAHNRSLYRDLSSFLKAGNSYDVVIATTPRLEHVLAYWFLFWRFRDQGLRKLVLVFVEAVGRYSPDYSRIRFSASSLPLKCCFILFRLLIKTQRVFLVTESEGLARQFEEFCGISFPLVPHVTRLPDLEPYRAKAGRKLAAGGNPLVLGTYGFTRFDKGLDILQEAIKILRHGDKDLGVRFVVQWTGDYRLPNGTLIRRDPLLENSTLVHYLDPFSTSEQYYECLAQTDIMILPYRKDFYFDKLSRVAIDAALAGMPFVYPAGTWLESFAKQHGVGVAFQPENPASLAKAINEAVERHLELKSCAEARRHSVSEAFSARAFFKIISDFPDIKGQTRQKY